ncbi:unnamed protein product [Phytophthora fragariaefolia]|uniref:Unnamed protein product n=1 Tax=Phytophthora fragariaefolia TaxID=1490495 RepID=A0A9W6TL97_9STRA|nr:unnamed protein product [Phytophthora fragariaefolia]
MNGKLTFITIYVDDLILFAPTKTTIAEMKKMLSSRFTMKDLGEIHFILGWEITRNRDERTVFISQRKYAETVLQRFQMDACNGSKTPSDMNLKLSKAMCPREAEERELMRTKPYRAVVGSLMYLMLGTRPALAYWSDQKLDDHLRAYADADFANRVDDRKSMARYLTQFCGSPISWSCQTERTVALHTTEAEYMAVSLLVQEVVHLRQMLKELRVQQQQPSQVFMDNESAKKLASNPVFHSRTKHIDVRHHFVRERVDLKQSEVLRVPGSAKVADAFTKPLPRPTFEKHRANMGLQPRAEFGKHNNGQIAFFFKYAPVSLGSTKRPAQANQHFVLLHLDWDTIRPIANLGYHETPSQI